MWTYHFFPIQVDFEDKMRQTDMGRMHGTHQHCNEWKCEDYATTNLYVARLPDWVTDDWLHMQFRAFGMIVSCKVLNEGPSGPRGVGFVQYTQAGI